MGKEAGEERGLALESGPRRTQACMILVKPTRPISIEPYDTHRSPMRPRPLAPRPPDGRSAAAGHGLRRMPRQEVVNKAPCIGEA